MIRRPCFAALLAVLASLAGCSCDEPADLAGRQPELSTPGGVDDPASPGRLLVDFGDVVVGARREREVMIENVGSAPLTVPVPALAAPFSSGSVDLVLEGGTRMPLQLLFQPDAVGPAELVVELASDGGNVSLRLIGNGVAPTLTCEPAAVDFGKVVVGLPRTLTVSCVNGGIGPTRVQALPIGLPEFSHFQGGEVVEVAPGERLAVQVTFQPSSVGPFSSRLSLASADGGEVAGLPLTGEGILQALVVEPDVTCPGLAFGFVPPGSVAEQVVTLRNAGSVPLAITALSVSGASDFSISPTGALTLGVDDPATPGREDMVLVTVRFTPVGTGHREARIHLESDDPSMPALELCLTGFAGGPQVSCSPAALDFGPIGGGLSASRDVVCTNIGTDDPGTLDDRLLLEAVTVAGAGFTGALVGTPRPEGYGVGDLFTVHVIFAPNAEGPENGTLTIASNAPELVVPLSGTGGAPHPCVLVVTPPTLSFGVVEPGRTATRTVTLTNAENKPCNVAPIALSADSDPAFSLRGSPLAPITLVGGNVVLTVDLDGGAGQERWTGTLEIGISNPANPLLLVPLSGSGCPQVAPDGSCQSATEALYVHDPTDLSSFDPLTTAATTIGQFVDAGGTLRQMTDIAVNRNGQMYAVSGSGNLYEVDSATAEVTLRGPLEQPTMGLTALDDGRLVSAGAGVWIIDPVTGATTRELVPAGQYETSGDIIALPDGFLYWTVRGGDTLVRIDPVSGDLALMGNVGETGIFGLAYAYGALYGFTSDGNVLEIDPATAAVRSSRAIAVTYWGAASNPVLW